MSKVLEPPPTVRPEAPADASQATTNSVRQPTHRARVKWSRWAWAFVVLVAAGSVAAYKMSPRIVRIGVPEERLLAETIASSGVAQGHIEVSVGAQAQGIVTQLLVEEGAQVKKGQLLARVQNNVALQQLDQARQGLLTARAVLAQASAGPRPSEIRSAQAGVDQAHAAILQQRAMIAKAKLARSQADTNLRQAKVQVSRAETAVHQSEARLGLAKKTLDRKSMLAGQGAIPKADLDSAQSAYEVAVQDLAANREALNGALLAVDTAGDAVQSSAQDERAASDQLAAANARLEGAKSDLATLRSRPRAEDVAVASQRVNEAEAAVSTSATLAGNTDILAPFDGTVTDILAQVGSSPGASGVLRLVQTGRLEIKLDLDEANLRDVRIGQRAVISVPSGSTDISGHVARIGSQIDSLRGTLEVYVVTDKPASWIHPGQTLNVNVVTVEKAQRLLVPSAAVQREGDQTLVYIENDGRAVAKPVRLGLVLDDKVAVLEGLTPTDRIIENSYQIMPGMRVREQK